MNYYFLKGFGLLLVTISVALGSIGCSTTGKKIATGMVVGAVVGAGVGHTFVHHGENKQYETQNTIITSLIFALGTGGVMAWHYRDLERQSEEISGRYARYQLCDNEDMQNSSLVRAGVSSEGTIYQLSENQIGKHAIHLDDNTKWVYPVFRKRFLMPELSEMQVTSKRYVWEIIKPGTFITRSLNPQYFLEVDTGTNPEGTSKEK